MSERQWIQAAVLGAFGVMGLFIWGLVTMTDPGPRPEPIYHQGQYVKSTLSGQRGQVMRTICYRGSAQCLYSVRFIGLSITTQTAILGPDGPVSTEPLSIVDMYEFELIAD